MTDENWPKTWSPLNCQPGLLAYPMAPLRIPLLAFLGLLAFARVSAADAAMDCPPAPQNVAQDIVTDTEASAKGLGSLVGGSLKNHTEVTAKNLFAKYPNADRVAIAMMMMSVFCQITKNSTTLSDAEKLDALQIENQSVMNAMTAMTAGAH